MNSHGTILMVAYTHYASDPRVIREAEAALGAGFEVDFLALRRAGDPAIEHVRGVRVIHLSQYRYRGGGYGRYLLTYLEFFVRCFWRTSILFWQRRYRVIHVNNMPDFLVFCTLLPKLFGAKVVLDIHDPMPNTFASKFRTGEKGFFFKLLLWQELLSAWYSDRVLTVHEPVKRGVLVPHGLAADAIHVIANFADGDLFALRPAAPVEGKIRFVFHGTILERSGLRILVHALSRVTQKDRISVRIIGDGDFSGELKRIIVQHHLDDVVEFDHHSYPVHELPRRLAECHVGLVPLEISSITNHALPLKLLEYISLGLPVITVRSAAITHYFGEEDCLFYQWDDPEALRNIFEKIIADPGVVSRYRQRVLEIRDRFLWQTEREKYVALLQDLAGVCVPVSSGTDKVASTLT